MTNEGIILAIISGIFSLTGVWLTHYLQGVRNNSKSLKETEELDEKNTKEPQNPKNSEITFKQYLTNPLWWLIIILIISLTIGSAFFAQWIINYSFSVLNIDLPIVSSSQKVLFIAGIVWGIIFSIFGTIEALDYDEGVLSCLSSVFLPISELFDPWDFNEFITNLLSAIPFNFIFTWLSALVIASISESMLGANFSGVVYLIFGVLNIFGLIKYLLNADI